jgi:pSer/pThr/pTyr-binding forkhead associated (FHA) protein
VTTSFTLAVDDPDVEPYPLERTVTVGRHLANDLVLAGEDVRDFHVRVEIGERGPRVIALEHATAHVGEQVINETHGVMPGDVIVIGHHRIRVDLDASGPVYGWTIHDMRELNAIPLDGEVLVGRGEACRLKLKEGHVSRRHAVLSRVANTVWVKDLGSSNGTFVNGERVVGARRLFHGDEVAFDLFRYQLIGDDPELTPIRPPGEAPVDDFAAAVAPDATQPPRPPPGIERAVPARAALASSMTSAPVLVEHRGEQPIRTYALKLGRQVLGRAANADVRLAGTDVADRHAEIDLRADGASLIHLAPGATTARNGKVVTSAKLEDGDVLTIGSLELTFQTTRAMPTRFGKVFGLAAAAIAAVGLLTWLVLA